MSCERFNSSLWFYSHFIFADESWEVQTETDSDDLEFEEENNKFDEAYEAALRAEYKQSLPVFHNENSDYTGKFSSYLTHQESSQS